MTSIRRNADTRLTEVGHLYVGDEVLIPGTDIFFTVIGFQFHDQAPGQVTVLFDGSRPWDTSTTHVVRVAC